MKKTLIFTLVSVMTVTAANASWFSDLFSSKPKTLEEACNRDEITAICPDVIFGSETIQECVADNFNRLSKQCTDFVKNMVIEEVEDVQEHFVTFNQNVEELTEEQKQAIAEKKAAAKAAKEELKRSIKETKAAAKAAAAAEKEALKATVTATKSVVKSAPVEAENVQIIEVDDDQYMEEVEE